MICYAITTNLSETEYTCKTYIIGEVIRQEDILEKYNIETSTDLEKILNKYFNKEMKDGKIDL